MKDLFTCRPKQMAQGDSGDVLPDSTGEAEAFFNLSSSETLLFFLVDPRLNCEFEAIICGMA